MKIAVLGGGGFRVPMVYGALLERSGRLGVEEVALFDVDGPRLARIAPVLAGLERERGERLAARPTTDLDDALEGADFVFCAIRVGRLEGRVVDERVPLDEGVVGQETTGPAGLCFALRTVPVMVELAEAVAERAPQRVVRQLHEPGRPRDRGDPGGARRPGDRDLRLAGRAVPPSRRGARPRSGQSSGSTISASTTSAGSEGSTTATATSCRSCSPTTSASPASRRGGSSAATGCGRSG